MKKKLPWGVYYMPRMFACEVYTRIDGRLVRVPASPYSTNIFERVRAAWWVLSGRAEAVIWPEPGDLEECFPGATQPRKNEG